VQNNYYLIRQIVISLKNTLAGATITECFSQNKDELILQFSLENKKVFNIIAHLNPQFSCLSFPEEYHKAKRNTATVFNEIIGKKVSEINDFLNERAFIIYFNSSQALLFKLFGHQSNILLINEDKVSKIFKNNLIKDFNIDIKNLNRPIDQSKSAIIKALPNLQSVYPTLDRRTRTLIEQKLVNLDEEEAYNKLDSLIKQLEQPIAYYLFEDENKRIKLSLFPPSKVISKYNSPFEALTQFFRLYIKKYRYQSEQQKLIKKLHQELKKTKSYITKTRIKWEMLLNNSSYKQLADIIMANLHRIEAHSSSIELENFYTNSPIKIKLNPKLSAQKNAEKYYSKAKNLNIEIQKLEEAISAKEKQEIRIKNEIETIKKSSTIRDLQKFSPKKKNQSVDSLALFKNFNIDEYTVLVGKNAKNNDLLTLKYAKKNDLFFHAKDVSGSHVILKQIHGKVFPAKVLEKTAALAAYYSKRKTDTLCPVGYTQKKYVRKPKGSPAGLVLVEREKVILVKPELPN
jgi:predicted ribosome quality control (RQC) complex YloA/Tae2 family protein